MAQSLENLIAERNLLDLATQGDAGAIASLLNRSLKPKGIAVQAKLDPDCLHLLLESSQVPSQEWVPFLQQGITNLGVPSIRLVKVYGRQRGTTQTAWQEVITLGQPIGSNPPVIDGNLPVTHFELGGGAVNGQQVVIGSKILQITGQGGVVTLSPQRKPPLLRSRQAPSPSASCRPITDLIDRQEEQEAVLTALKQSIPIEFYGVAGVGKTALLRSLAHHPAMPAVAPDGIVYRAVGQQPVEDLLQAIFDDFFEYDGGLPQRPADEEIWYALRGKQALVLLDDVRLARQSLEPLLNDLPSLHFILAAPEQQLWDDSVSTVLTGLPPYEALMLLDRYIGGVISPQEHPAAETLCTLLHGNPLQIAQVATLVREQGESFATLVTQIQAGATPATMILQTCAALPETERRVLAALGVLGDTSVQAHHLGGLVGTSNLQPMLASLVHQGFVVTNGIRYTLAGNLLVPLRQFWNLSQWEQPIVRYFLSWARQHVQVSGALAQESNLLTDVVRLAFQKSQWAEVVQLVRLTEGAIATSCYWGTWEQLWQMGLQAAENLGDQAMIAHAWHQLGTRALCLDDTFTAHTYLTQALHLREAIGNQTGVAATRHNLGLLLAPTAQPPQSLATQLQLPPHSQAAAQLQPLPQRLPDPVPLAGASSLSSDEPARRSSAVLPIVLTTALFFVVGGFVAMQMFKTRSQFVLTSDRLDFASQALNTTSSGQTLTLQNMGDQALSLGSITPTGANPTDFQVTEECTKAPLPPSQTCTVQVTFTPQSQGDRIADLAIANRRGELQRSVPLKGSSPISSAGSNTGNPLNPEQPNTGNATVTLRLEPGNIDFGDQLINQLGKARSIVLVNDSLVPVTIQRMQLAGAAQNEFQFDQQCTGGPLAPGQSCPIQVSFQPVIQGDRPATLEIFDTANRRWNVPLQGNGVAAAPQVPRLSITPGSYDFGREPINTVSRAQTFTIANLGTQPLVIERFSQSGASEFKIVSNSCQTGALAPNRTCQIGVTFYPRDQRDFNATLRVLSNDPRGATDIFLSGRGRLPVAAGMSVNPTALNFGAINLENSSEPRAVTISNTGSAPLLLGDIRVGGNGDFVSDRNTPIGAACSNITLQPGQNCGFNVVFLPQVAGDRTAQITIPSNSPNSPATVTLRGTSNLQQLPALSINLSSIDFSNQGIGTTSAPQSITLRNGGSASLQTGTLAFGGTNPYDFSASNSANFAISCSNITLAPGQFCAVQVLFAPQEAGYRNAQLIIPSTGSGSPARVTVGGVGLSGSSPGYPSPVPPIGIDPIRPPEIQPLGPTTRPWPPNFRSR